MSYVLHISALVFPFVLYVNSDSKPESIDRQNTGSWEGVGIPVYLCLCCNTNVLMVKMRFF